MNTIEQAREVSLDIRDVYADPLSLPIRAADTIDALIEELAALKGQEPVAWMCCVPGQDPCLLFDKPSDERYPPGYKDPLFLAVGAQPVQQEPVLYQRRMRPEWREHEWFPWETCTKECADDFERKPILNNWIYEVRRLYAQPVQREPAAWEHCFVDPSKKILSYTKTCAGFPPRDDAYQINPLYAQPVQAHGIKEQP